MIVMGLEGCAGSADFTLNSCGVRFARASFKQLEARTARLGPRLFHASAYISRAFLDRFTTRHNNISWLNTPPDYAQILQTPCQRYEAQVSAKRRLMGSMTVSLQYGWNLRTVTNSTFSVEDTLLEFQNKLKDAENASHEAKKKHEMLWPVFQITHQRKYP